jgi:hypothetical protein
VHEGLQLSRDVPVVDKAVFLDLEFWIKTFKIAGVIVSDSLSQNQILRPGRSADRVGLYETHLLQRCLKRDRLRKVSRNSKAPQILERDRQ